MLVYALTKGYLDSIKITDLKDYEAKLFRYLDFNELGQKVINNISLSKQLPDEELMKQLFTEFSKTLLN